MNSLNSVLIEGVLVDDPEKDGEYAKFQLRSLRTRLDNGIPIGEATIVEIISLGNVAAFVMGILSQGALVKITGRLTGCGNAVRVFAEHLSITPGQKND